MSTHDHYDTLGIASSESMRAVHAAYRDLARHDGPAGSRRTRSQQRIHAAHAVLSDVRARASYDRVRALDLTQQPRVREPSGDDVALSLLGDFHGAEPSGEVVRRWIRQNFTHEPEPKSGSVHTLALSVALAGRPRTIAIALPVYRACTACHGSGRAGWGACLTCEGSGFFEEGDHASIALVATERANVTYEVPLHELGIRNVHLKVRVSRA